jgi:hypothetical protein
MAQITLYELLARYEATRDDLRAINHPDATAYDVLIANVRQMIGEFERSGAAQQSGEE